MDGIRDLLVAAAVTQGLHVDVGQVLEGLAGAVRAFTRRRAAAEALGAVARRRRLHSLTRILSALEDALYGLERDEGGLPREERDSVAIWGSREGFAAWRDQVELYRVAVERRLARYRAARPGPRRDRAVRRLILDVAWVLHSEGYRLTTYPEGLLAQVATATARAAGHELPEDRWLRRLLRPAVRFVRGGGVPASAEPISALTDAPLDPLPSMVRKVKR